MKLEPMQSLSLEERLEQLERKLSLVQGTLSISIHYSHIIAMQMGLNDEVRKLEEKLKLLSMEHED